MTQFLLSVLFWSLRAVFRSRKSLFLENLALRQQLATYARGQKRPPVKARGATILGNPVEGVERLAVGLVHGQAADRHRVAPAGSTKVLALAVPQAGAAKDP